MGEGNCQKKAQTVEKRKKTKSNQTLDEHQNDWSLKKQDQHYMMLITDSRQFIFL